MTGSINVKVVLFASLREMLGEAEVSVTLGLPALVSDVIAALGKSRGGSWSDQLSEEKVLTAVNHTMVDQQHVLQEGDEVAFYPPVTGG